MLTRRAGKSAVAEELALEGTAILRRIGSKGRRGSVKSIVHYSNGGARVEGRSAIGRYSMRFSARPSSVAATVRMPPAAAPRPTTAVQGRSLASRLSKGIEKYPFLTFSAIMGTTIAGNTALVNANTRAHERDVLRAKQKQGLPIVDLTNELKEIQTKPSAKPKSEKAQTGKQR